MMGDIIRPMAVPMTLSVEAIGTAPLERVDILHGTQVVHSARPYTAADLGRRVRILWQGAEYRGRGRETMWQGKLVVTGNRFTRFAPVNFLNPERRVQEISQGNTLAWTSVTTGNLAGIDLWLEEISCRPVANRDQYRVGRGAARPTCRRCGRLRRRWTGSQAQRLPIAGDRLEPAARGRASRRLYRRRRPAGLRSHNPGGRPSSVVKPNLFD